jgi:acylphosphatase
MSKRCLRCTIFGKVQGVFYRANTKNQAQKLGITGWVRNLPDGNVEALICGDENALLAMQQWLSTGPMLAHVTQIKIEESDEMVLEEFQIL